MQNRYLRLIKDLDKQSVKEEDKLLKSLIKRFKIELVILQRQLTKLYREYENEEGEFDYTKFVIDNKDIEYNLTVANSILGAYKTLNPLLEELLNKQVDEVFITLVGKGIEKEINTQTIVENLSRSWRDTNDKNKLQSIHKISRAVKEGLEKGQTYTQVSERLVKQTAAAFWRVERVVRQESHRVLIDSTMESLKEIQKTTPILKQWVTMGDERVRESHHSLDGQIREIHEPFELPNGLTAQAPTQFGDPQEDIGCRCLVTLIPK